jgi:hypothetical protein
VLLGFGLRAGRLEYQSLWYDEGSSIFLARQPLGAITSGAAHDIHPPLYYYLLHFWMAAGGSSEYAVRFLSLGAGLAVVPLLFVLGRRLFGFLAGLLAALAGAASPLLVYYSQEARMYAQVALLGLLSTYLLVRAAPSPAAAGEGWGEGTRRDGRRGAYLWTAYALAAAACLYSQYIGALALAFQGLYVLIARRKWLLPAALSGGAAALAFVPWVALARDSLLGWPSTDAFHAGPQLFGDAAFRYVEGLSANMDALGIALTVAVCVVAAAGVVRSKGHWLLPALYVAVPIGAMFLLGYRKPVYNPKFALLALPGFLLLLGTGLSRAKRLTLPALAVTLAAAGYALNNYYANPEFARDDYRGVARFISTSGRPGDAIILDAPGQEQVFPYYYSGPLPVLGLPADRPLNPERTAQQLADLNGRFKRLWLVLYGTNGSDPEAYVERWLGAKDFEIQNQWFGSVRLAAFAAPSTQTPAARPADATLGGFAHLAGYTLTPQPAPSGDVLQLGLKWQVQGQAPGAEKVFTHVIDGDGSIWAQRDSDPVGGARPTGGWKPGEAIDDNYGLLVLPGTPPGEYQAEIGMYDPARPARRLPVTAGGSGDRLLLGTVRVSAAEQPPSLDELRIPHPLDRRLGLLDLLGYGLTLVGQDAQRDTFAAGDLVQLTLFWQSEGSISPDAQLALSVGSTRVSNGVLVPQHPTSTWQAGDRYRDQHRLQLPGDARGDLDLTLAVNGQPPIVLTRIHVR